MSDSPQAEYEAKQMATTINLRKYYNSCVEIMAKVDAEEMAMEDSAIEFIALDKIWAKNIVDDISPKRNILEL